MWTMDFQARRAAENAGGATASGPISTTLRPGVCFKGSRPPSFFSKTVDMAESLRASALFAAVLTLRWMHTSPPQGPGTRADSGTPVLTIRVKTSNDWMDSEI